jgi:hypothetical protein
VNDEERPGQALHADYDTDNVPEFCNCWMCDLRRTAARELDGARRTVRYG